MLRLANDTMAQGQPLSQALSHLPQPAHLVAAIAAAVPALANRLATGRIYGDPTAIISTNASGDKQKALDIAAHDHMIAALQEAGARAVLSEEEEAVLILNPKGQWDVAIDPIDGSGSIGIGAPLGLLFSILPAHPSGFLRSGRSVVAAGYASFGHSCDFGFSLGAGVQIATLDHALGDFRILKSDVRLPLAAKTIAYNASNERHWPRGLQRWVTDLRAGRDGPRARDFNMRWLAAAVGELHRILLLGGCFLYPADRRTGYENGRLRLIYEAAPIAFLIEQAGGKASDGVGPILDRIPQDLHENTPLIFGAAEEVDIITRYLANDA